MDITGGKSRIGLILEYDGAHYAGFQYQTEFPTIQGELEQAIRKLTGEDRRVLAASRTDAGVHAAGQVVSFWTGASYSLKAFVSGLNHYLPNSICVKEACWVTEGFNVRREAVSREYRYSIFNGPVGSPLRRNQAHLVTRPLDLEAMSCASEKLCGRHDFASFAPREDKGCTVRTVYKTSVGQENGLIVFDIIAGSFLRHQVRNIVGTLIRIGLGKIGTEHVRHLLESKSPGQAGPKAPAHGLCLMRVNYPQPLGVM